MLIVNGDMPLITGEAIAALVAAHEEAGAAATIATMELDDPTGYGRVVRDADGGVERVVETKAAGRRDRRRSSRSARSTPASTCSTAARCSPRSRGSAADNAQGELYLPDVLPLLRADGQLVQAYPLADPDLALGVNDRVDLAHVTAPRPARGSTRRTSAPA